MIHLYRRSSLAVAVLLWLSSPLFVSGAGEPTEPSLYRTQLRIEPTAAQMEGLPDSFAARWRFSPLIAPKLAAIMEEMAFPPEFAQAIQDTLRVSPETGEGSIEPTTALLETLSEDHRRAWWGVLGHHAGNQAYRWPICVPVTVLDSLAVEPGFEDAVGRIRRWGALVGPRIQFADLFTLEGAFADTEMRRQFWKQLLSVDTEFLKLIADKSQPREERARQLAYWQAGPRNRSLEPFLEAIANIHGHDRIDVAHLLPRLGRSLLYTYPPDFAAVRDPSFDNAAMAASFFALTTKGRPAMPSGFSAWLNAHCDAVTGPRTFGDIVVFEESKNALWPYAAIYIADGIVFGRRPTLFGPWELMDEGELALINPRLGRARPTTYRTRRPERAFATTNPTPVGWEQADTLEPAAPGPWGKIATYRVLLAPSSQLLESIEVPSAQPIWHFTRLDELELEAALNDPALAPTTRSQLRNVFAEATRSDNGYVAARPSLDLALATPASFRQRLFPRLVHGLPAADYAQEVNLSFHSSEEAWLAPRELSHRARQTLQNLIYQAGDRYRLSDYGALYHAFGDTAERVTAYKALLRAPARIALLKRPDPSELPALAAYWRFDQQKSVKRLLTTFAESETMRYLDIAHLLPPLSRELLNTFLPSDPNTPAPSCYWTALNFTAEQPDPQLLVSQQYPKREIQAVVERLRRDYTKVPEANRIGDVILYHGADEYDLRHACSFVAADIVFTKNGIGGANPWCLMTIAEVDALYSAGGVRKSVYRLKE